MEKAIRDYSREAGQTPEEVVAQRDRLKKTRDTARSICRTLDDLQEVRTFPFIYQLGSQLTTCG